MTLDAQIRVATADALRHIYPDVTIDSNIIAVNETKPEFKGEYTIVLFPFLKLLRQKPDAIGKQIGDYLVANTTFVKEYEIVSGFLNLVVKDSYWADFLTSEFANAHYGEKAKTDNRIMVEYSSPNTNKPLHFGHLRNIFLGAAMSEILKVNGNEVVKANLINDRGIHICKSMIAWMHYGNGATPESTGIKGDHLVGDYYVKFNDVLNQQIKPDLDSSLLNIVPGYVNGVKKQGMDQYVASYIGAKKEFDLERKLLEANGGIYAGALELKDFLALLGSALEGNYKWKDVQNNKNTPDGLRSSIQKIISFQNEMEEAKSEIKEILSSYAPIMKEAAELLRKWEAGDKEVRSLWATMNGWVYKGFNVSYDRMGITFDKMYYESNTYLLGKELVQSGLVKGVLFQKEDGSIWVDLTDEGLDQKLLQRSDGTSVYMTQDLGTAKLKYDEFKLDQSVYVIGDEQNYHMNVLKLVMKKLGEPCADGIYHLSYGMVELPTGKMKSREGTVVDADDMVAEMVCLSQEQTEQAGKTEGFTADELTTLYNTIGLGALKFYLLRVEPKKKMIFDPKESIDLHGFTATFIQYAHARICSILRKENVSLTAGMETFAGFALTQDITPAEKKMIHALEMYPLILEQAATEYNPSAICNYSFQLAQSFNSFYDEHHISKAENEEKKNLRLMIILMTAHVLRHGMGLLGIGLPEKM